MRALGRAALLAWALIAAPLAAAQAGAAPAVVASIKPIHSLVAGVMAGLGEPRLLVEAGQSPHTYSLKPSQAQALENADLVVWVGPGLEAFLERPVAHIARPSAGFRLLRVEGLTIRRTREGGAWDSDGHDHGDESDASHAHESEHGHSAGTVQGIREAEVDPHIWLDPDNAVTLVDAIAARLADLDPANAAAYADNAKAMRARIRAADADARRMLAPVADIPYVVFHDAYQYFEAHYGLNVAGSITISPDRQPGARRLMAIRERMAALGARCVFREPQFPPALVRTVVEGTDVGVGALDPLGLDHEAGPEAYPGTLRDLARNLVDCLDPSR